MAGRSQREGRALSRCLLSLSQKLKEPSEPAVTNVPYLRAAPHSSFREGKINQPCFHIPDDCSTHSHVQATIERRMWAHGLTEQRMHETIQQTLVQTTEGLVGIGARTGGGRRWS